MNNERVEMFACDSIKSEKERRRESKTKTDRDEFWAA